MRQRRGHGGRFDMMHRPRSAAGNHLPHLARRCHGSGACGLPSSNRPSDLSRATHRSKSTSMPRSSSIAFTSRIAARPPWARMSILTKPDGFHGIHVEMRRGVALVGDESRRQFVHRLAREHEAARVHLGIARHAVEEFGHLQRGLVRFFVQRQVSVFGTGPQHFDQTRAAARASVHPAPSRRQNSTGNGR